LSVGGKVAAAGEESRLVLLSRVDSAVLCSVGPTGKIAVHDELSIVDGGALSAIALNAKGDRLAIGSANGFVATWEIPVDITSRSVQLREIQGEDDDVEEDQGPTLRAERVPAHHCAASTHVRAYSNLPVSCLTFEPRGDLIAAGTPDGRIRVFDVQGGHCTHNFSLGAAGGGAGITSIVFRSSIELFAATEEGDIRKFELVTGREQELRNHAGAVSRLLLVDDGQLLVSCGRDSVLTVWRTEDGSVHRTIVTDESITAAVASGKKLRDVCTAGERGGLRFWDVARGLEKSRKAEPKDIVDLAATGSSLLIIDLEGSITIVDGETAQNIGVTIGNLDEVYDVQALDKDTLVVAYNSTTVQLLCPNESDVWDHAGSLKGHSGTILAIDVSDGYIATASKDKTARVFKLDENTGSPNLHCSAEGHTDAVGAVALARSRKSMKPEFFVTGASDRTIKLWSLKTDGNQSKALWTVFAHEKDINSIAVSPDNRLVASGSQDRTLKLWSRTDGKPLATCTGHRRGIWSLAFSPTDRVVASASGDRTVRIWNTNTGSCLRTLEGHGAAVLKVLFISGGTQVATAGADGMVRVWSASDGSQRTCIDAHGDRIWALTTVGDGDKLVSGAADGTLRVWADVTERVRQEKLKVVEEHALKDQEVENALRGGDWCSAVRGAVELDQPRRLETILAKMLNADGPGKLAAVVRELCQDDASSLKLMQFCRDWNAIGGSASMAAVTHAIMRHAFESISLEHAAEIFRPAAERSVLDALAAHSRRHFDRVKAMSAEISFLDYLLHRMKSLEPVGDGRRENGGSDDVEDKEPNSSSPSFTTPTQGATGAYESIESLRRRHKQHSRERKRKRTSAAENIVGDVSRSMSG